MSSWERTAWAQRGRGGGALVGENRAPLPSPATPAPPSPAGKENPYVLLGEDRLSKAKARRGRLKASRIGFPPPPFRHRLRRCHLPPREGETSYVLLGEDRLSKAKARRGSLSKSNLHPIEGEGKRFSLPTIVVDGLWRSLVAHCVWDAGVVGSNPTSPTMAFTLPDSSFGVRARRRLEEEVVAWLTTVSPKGTPQPSPIWFLWDGDSILIYSKAGTSRTRNLASNETASFNFDGNGTGGDIVVFEGRAEISDDPPSTENVAYQTKYLNRIVNMGMTPESFAEGYPIPLRFYPRRLRGH